MYVCHHFISCLVRKAHSQRIHGPTFQESCLNLPLLNSLIHHNLHKITFNPDLASGWPGQSQVSLHELPDEGELGLGEALHGAVRLYQKSQGLQALLFIAAPHALLYQNSNQERENIVTKRATVFRLASGNIII